MLCKVNLILFYFNRTLHVFIFVHGLHGTHYDLRSFKNNLSLVYPHALFLLSNINENLTENDITSQGKNLATEIRNFISE